jgi:hypothetical protein
MFSSPSVSDGKITYEDNLTLVTMQNFSTHSFLP